MCLAASWARRRIRFAAKQPRAAETGAGHKQAVRSDDRLEQLGADHERHLPACHLLDQKTLPLERPLRIEARLSPFRVDAQKEVVAAPGAVQFSGRLLERYR